MDMMTKGRSLGSARPKQPCFAVGGSVVFDDPVSASSLWTEPLLSCASTASSFFSSFSIILLSDLRSMLGVKK